LLSTNGRCSTISRLPCWDSLRRLQRSMHVLNSNGAIELRHLIEERFRAADGAFYPDEEHSPTWESNPHMHLLEACLTWTEIGSDTGWAAWARGLVQLALS